MKSFLCRIFLICVLASTANPAVMVEMLVDNSPIDLIMVPNGSSFTIDFSIVFDDPFPDFYGIVELTGVGVLNEPTYLDDPGIIPPPIIPPVLPNNQWPLYYPQDVSAIPSMGVFASSIYDATETGTATVNLYQTEDFSYFTLIDSFDIHVIPEPATWLILCSGGLLIRRKRA